MIKQLFGTAAMLLLAGAASAALTPAEIVARHNAAVAKSDLEAMMADYADDAVVIEEGKTFQGKAAIRGLLGGMFPKPVPGAAPTGAATMNVTKRWAEGDVGYFTWTLGPINGTDEFLVRNGKIEVQAVFIKRPAQ